MTDPVARDSLAALLHEHRLCHSDWCSGPQHHENAADALLAAGVLPADTLAKVRAEIAALRRKDRVYVEEDDYVSGFGDAHDAVLAILDRAIGGEK